MTPRNTPRVKTVLAGIAFGLGLVGAVWLPPVLIGPNSWVTAIPAALATLLLVLFAIRTRRGSRGARPPRARGPGAARIVLLVAAAGALTAAISIFGGGLVKALMFLFVFSGLAVLSRLALTARDPDARAIVQEIARSRGSIGIALLESVVAALAVAAAFVPAAALVAVTASRRTSDGGT